MNNPAVDLAKHDLNAALLKRIGRALPKFLTQKHAKDAEVFISGCKYLTASPVECVFSYRQGFAAALEYVRDRVNPSAPPLQNAQCPILDADEDDDLDDGSIYDKM